MLDKFVSMGYNGIVNSKGAADDKSAALFWFIALIPYTMGCMMYRTTGMSYTPLIFIQVPYNGVRATGIKML